MTFSRRRLLALWAALALAVAAAYAPAWRAGFIWDDDAHVTRPELRGWSGLGRIWCDLGATQQYYPVLHSAFWIEHRLWGGAPLGYHLLNLLLHATAAWLFARVLLRLGLAEPAAVFAAFLFALHPVEVESVAWISEQKNTLSAVFYLGAALTYLGWQERRRGGYGAATALFLLAILSKSVTATLPAALLVALWWRRGRLEFRRDVWPLLAWLALGLSGGLFTAWVERRFVGATGAPFALDLAQRFLTAGHAPWFYLGKLLWPARLLFIYPRWMMAPADPLQWIPLAALGGILAWFAALARRRRGPLACALFFLGTLFPALGFFNVYPFLFSYVADHFQYLASLGVLAGAAGLWAAWPAPAALRRAAAAALLLALGALTFRQAGLYRDVEGLYRATLARNPQAWLADLNLGSLLRDRGRARDAADLYRQAIAIYPGYADTHFDLGLVLLGQGRYAEAAEQFAETVGLNPRDAQAWDDYGVALGNLGQLDEAVARFQHAIRLNPGYAKAHRDLGLAWQRLGRPREAEVEFEAAARLGVGR
ncbi:MAG TPA: tetratricopeptide repeat protein [Opitutaceae bacterium]|nr:tetratricopeptide repeat protein [Opitutaceae bacterium]